MKNLQHFFLLFISFFLGLFFTSSVFAREVSYFKKYADETTYLDLSQIGRDVINNKIIGLPPAKGSVEKIADKESRKEIANTATDAEKLAAVATPNSIFSFSVLLGDWFNFSTLPKTALLFQKVDNDASLAVDAAKQTFQAPRPFHASGYSYPSGYATRAFIWATLLKEIFPNDKTALYRQAEQEGENRIILKRQYPSGVAAGKIYGKYLADQFLKNPRFQKEWKTVKQEIIAAIPPNAISVTH